MGNIFMGLNIGRSALLAGQTALDVTGHNLANTQTDGYTRQRVSLVPLLPIPSPQGPQGSGVDVNRIQRLHVSYLERQVLKAKTEDGYNTTLTQGLDELQALLGEPSSDGLGGALSEFWNSWEALSAQPSDASLRAQAVDRAEHLALVYNQKIQGFQEQEETLESAVAGDVELVNSWTRQIVEFNKSIAQAEFSGYTANDLRDQRDLMVEQLAQKVGIEAETDGSYVNIRLGNGGPYLVQGVSSLDVARSTDASGATVGLRVGLLEVETPGGSTGALIALRTQVSPELRSQLAELTATVVDRVNGLHASGYDRDGVPGGSLFQWSGTGDSIALDPAQGVGGVSPDADLPTGTHYLKVESVYDNLVPNSFGPAAGDVALTATTTPPSTYTGPQTINLDYHVRLVAANPAADSAVGAQFQLYRGDEALGGPQTLTAAGTLSWTGVDGVDFAATVALAPGEHYFASGTRSNGWSTWGTVSLDGGAAKDVDLTTQNGLTFDGGSAYGYAATGSATVSFTGAPFSGGSFTRYGSGGALSVRADVVADTDKLAVAGTAPTATGSATGDGEIARRIGDLSIGAIFHETGETAAGFLGRLVQALGSKARDSQVFERAGATISAQLDRQKQAASGVSTDEEMVNLMQYQRGFQAAAKFLTTVDSLVETLLASVGR
ncbi:MAG: flagellar hook-associated protein FlgK [Deltaproteobacteria bacterium]|nr:flagellar hook-associated protein FlgK [Deltaproteobacteria bacterium]